MAKQDPFKSKLNNRGSARGYDTIFPHSFQILSAKMPREEISGRLLKKAVQKKSWFLLRTAKELAGGHLCLDFCPLA